LPHPVFHQLEHEIKKGASDDAPQTCRACGSDGFLELLGGAEGNLLARLDLDRLAGGGVAAHAGGALAHLQDAEAAEADASALLEVLGHGHDEVVEDGVGRLLLKLLGLGKRRRKVLEGDGLDLHLRDFRLRLCGFGLCLHGRFCCGFCGGFSSCFSHFFLLQRIV